LLLQKCIVTLFTSRTSYSVILFYLLFKSDIRNNGEAFTPAKICSRNWNGSGTVLEHQEQF
jgi:hypothetical protein